MPHNCPTCNVNINRHSNCICCDHCHKWYHFDCVGISLNQFEIYIVDENFEWICDTCEQDTCNKCNLLFRHGIPITCTNCQKRYHLNCVGLKKISDKKNAKAIPINWFCYNCNNDIFPFNLITPAKIESLSFNSISSNKHFNKLRSLQNGRAKAESLQLQCSVCNKNNNNLETSIPCPTCNHNIHKRCSKLSDSQLSIFKRTLNMWECPTCRNRFPFSNLEDADIHQNAFNSNWTCKCKLKPTANIDPNSLKLVLDFEDLEKNFSNPNSEFDEQFDSYHSLKPKFNYYSTHEFHTLTKKKLSKSSSYKYLLLTI